MLHCDDAENAAVRSAVHGGKVRGMPPCTVPCGVRIYKYTRVFIFKHIRSVLWGFQGLDLVDHALFEERIEQL